MEYKCLSRFAARRLATAKIFLSLFFGGYTPKQAGKVDKAVLNQWYPAPFVVADVHDATAEHYMMAEKARLFS